MLYSLKISPSFPSEQLCVYCLECLKSAPAEVSLFTTEPPGCSQTEWVLVFVPALDSSGMWNA